MEKPKTAMPVVAGVLVIVSQGFRVLVLLGLFIASFIIIVPASLEGLMPLALIPVILAIFLVLAVLAVAGGVLALRRKKWGLALTGAIIAVLPMSFFGIAAVILLALSREEFE